MVCYEKKNQKLLNILLHYSANIPKVYSTFIEHSHSQKKKNGVMTLGIGSTLQFRNMNFVSLRQ
jgi:hypothetical protein